MCGGNVNIGWWDQKDDILFNSWWPLGIFLQQSKHAALIDVMHSFSQGMYSHNALIRET